MQWIATCPHETVEVLENELRALGIQEQSRLYRGIMFESDQETAYRAHLQLRTASRLQRVVATFDMKDLASLAAGLNNIVWRDWLRSHRSFTVYPTLADLAAQKMDEEAIAVKVIESIEHSAFEKGAPKYDPDSDTAIAIVPFIRGGTCVLGIDTAGRALHKRGWRTTGHPAVLKETMASTMLMMAGYTGEEVLLDPMCGSGTIVIEAAYMALNKAPLIHRGKDDFALEHLAGFDRALWRKISDQLRAQKKAELSAPIYANDINSKFVDVARAGALRGRVEKYLNFSVSSFQELQPPAPKGLLITNLPYGERIGSGIIDKLYRDVGQVLRERYAHWRVALLAPTDAPIHLLGLKTSREFKLLNGALPVVLLVRD